MDTFLVVIYLLNIVFGVINAIQKFKEDEEYLGWVCSVMGWFCALLSEIQ